jgi:hypothetical protein
MAVAATARRVSNVASLRRGSRSRRNSVNRTVHRTLSVSALHRIGGRITEGTTPARRELWAV